MKIYVDGQRLVVAKSSMVEQKVRDVFKKGLQFLSEDSHNNVEDIWSSIWKYSQSIPCFIYKSDILQKEAIIELEYYDSIHIKKKNRWGYLYPIDNRDIEYDYYPDKQHNSWLYVKSPEKFTIQVSNTPNTNYDVEFNGDDMDPEVVSCTIKPNNLQNNSSTVKFHIHIKVPKSLKFWYIVLYCLCISYILFIAVRIRCKLLDCQRVPDIIMEHNDAVLTIGVSIIALIIATRGWLVKEETILKRLLIFLSIMMGLISILLIVHTFIFRC